MEVTHNINTLILNGKDLSNTIKNQLKNIISDNNIQPGLGIILVGNRPDSKTYVRMKKRSCEKIGIKNFDIILSDTVSQEDIILEVEKMNNNPEIHGILIQLPLPKHINEQIVLSHVAIEKDVDGFHTNNVGNLTLNNTKNISVPCTPDGCIELLKYYNIEIEGKHVVVLGRSKIVGLPLSLLMLHNNATVTICHSRTQNLKKITQSADILISACGKAQYITQEYIKQGVVILDIGINKIDDSSTKKGYRLVGDVDFENVKNKTSAITPVPGGVGPMTIAMLLKHTVEKALFQKQNNNSNIIS